MIDARKTFVFKRHQRGSTFLHHIIVWPSQTYAEPVNELVAATEDDVGWLTSRVQSMWNYIRSIVRGGAYLRHGFQRIAFIQMTKEQS